MVTSAISNFFPASFLLYVIMPLGILHEACLGCNTDSYWDLHPLMGKSNADDHKGLVKIPRIFLAPPLLTTLAPTGTFPRMDGGPHTVGGGGKSFSLSRSFAANNVGIQLPTNDNLTVNAAAKMRMNPNQASHPQPGMVNPSTSMITPAAPTKSGRRYGDGFLFGSFIV